MTNPGSDRMADFRHALANPLAALIAEVQLTLMNAAQFDPETRQSLQDIEKLALRMREIMRDSRLTGAANPVSLIQEQS